MTRVSPPHPDAPLPGPSSTHRSSRIRGRRVTVVAFLVSAVIHALAVAIYPLLVGPGPRDAVSPNPEDLALPGLEVVEIAEISPPELTPPEPVRELLETADPEEPGAVEVAEETEPTPEPIGPPDRRALTPAEELRPRRGDPRLTAPLPEEIVAVNKEWVAQLQIVWALEELNDSAAAAVAAAAAGRTWTYTDDEGKTWGISPGKIHLGDVTLPLPFSFSAPPGSEAARQSWEDAEILRAAIEAVARETLEERARAIRERKDRERANGVPPDTTGTGGGGTGVGR